MGSVIQAGALADGAPATGVLTAKQIASKGSISLTSDAGAIDIMSGAGADQTTLNSVGGDLNVIAGGGALTLGDNAMVRVDGGNMFLHGENGLTGGVDNTFYARAVNSTGGGLQLAAGAGATNQIANAFTFPAGTAPPASDLGTEVVINNGGDTSGVVQALTGAAGQNNLSTSGSHTATLNLTGGVMVFESNGADVQLDGGTFTTEALQPIAFYTGGLPSIGDCDGAAFIFARRGMTIERPHTRIHVRKGALVSIITDTGVTRVAALSGPGHVAVVVGRHSIALNPGHEAVIAHHELSAQDTRPADGVGRRLVKTHEIEGGTHVAICDFSIVSLMSTADHMRALRQPSNSLERKLAERLVKTAAVLHQVTAGRGAYTGRARERRAAAGELVPVRYRTPAL